MTGVGLRLTMTGYVTWSTPLVTRDAQRRVFGVVQGLLEGDKDSSPSVQNDRVFRLTMTGVGPLAARPIGASAKMRTHIPTGTTGK